MGPSHAKILIQPGAASVIDAYVERMNRQRQALFASLDGLDAAGLWRPPAPEEWSIGEILEHTAVLNASMLPVFRAAWWALLPLARLRRHKPFAIDIENVYHRPGFPMGVGWLWPPRHNARNPIPLPELEARLEETHRRVAAFYTGKEPQLLGHIPLYDPLIGRLNLIQALKVGLDHDQLHYQDAQKIHARGSAVQ